MTNILKSSGINLLPEYAWLLQAMIADDNDLTSTSLPTNIQWPLLVDLSETHGMMPLLYHYLHTHHAEDTPDDILTDLEHRYKANELRNRILTQELLNIIDNLESHGIRALAYKGPSLTLSVYGDIALRQFGDLDILISAKDVSEACELLTEMGYQRTIPALTPAKENDFIRTDHEHEFISPDELVDVDLHWALSTQRFPFHMEPGQLFNRSESLALASGKIEHISDQDLLLLLCMHSNKDLWRKLIWACDIDRLIRTRSDIDWESFIQQAVASHCERMIYVSLLITHSLLHTPIPDFILNIAQQDEFVKLGMQAMHLCLEDRNANNLQQCLSIEPYILSICDNRTDRLRYIIRSLITPNENDMMEHNLPSSLHFLYYFIRPVRKLFFCSARSIKRFFFD